MCKKPKKGSRSIFRSSWKKDLGSNHFPKKGSRSGSLDLGSKDPNGMINYFLFLGTTFKNIRICMMLWEVS